MTQDKLVIEESLHGCQGFRIYWYLAEVGDLGAAVGEFKVPTMKPRESYKTDEDFQCHLVNHVAGKTEGVEHDHNSYFWETRAQAQRALRLLKAELKAARDNTPWPDWAKQALAAGWKAPKGWGP